MGRCIVDDFIEPGKLLEEFWFFANLLNSRHPKFMSRSLSDPGTSSNFNHEIMDAPAGRSFEETYESIKKLPSEEESRPQIGLTQGSSSIKPGVKSELGRKKLPADRKTLSDKLSRAPSLPVSVGSDEDEDDEEEVEFSMGKLIRQASINNSDTNSRKAHRSAKDVTLNSNISKNPTPGPMNRIQSQKSLNHVESLKYSQGFNDLSFDFHNKCLLKNVIPEVIQEEEKAQECECKNPRRGLYRSESAVPKWAAAEKMSAEDMKAQLKFWARSVASNVRLQEC